MAWFMHPWPWWLTGILIGLVVPLLSILAGKDFGISTSLQQIGAMCSPQSKLDYLRSYDRQNGLWTLVFAIGIAVGGFVGGRLLSSEPVAFLPIWSHSVTGAAKLFVGGCFVGFGARYAGGCTSGHSITGIANFNWPSLLATIFFFVGGIALTWTFGSLLF
jgi:uncharacterized membrane protein YedE/YeeE